MKLWFWAAAAIWVGTACEKIVEDEISPVVTRFDIPLSPYLPGESLEIQAGGSDNQGLTQVRLRVRSAFSKTFAPWTDLEIRDISGTSYAGNFLWVVPDSALAGYYEFNLQFSDERGNGSLDSTRFFTVERPGEAPVLTDFNTSPGMNTGGVIVLAVGDSLRFLGTASDDQGLDQVVFSLRSVSNTAVATSTTTFDSTVTTWSISDESKPIPIAVTTITPVRLLVQVTDTLGNLTRRSIPIMVGQ